MLIRILLLNGLILLITFQVSAQLTAGGDTTICKGQQTQLSASGGGASYYWRAYPPDASLLIPQQQNPIVAPQQNTMYVVQSNVATGNYILNGSFELGNTGFSSDYVNNQISIVDEGTYAVVNDAHTVHPNFFCNHDHTSGHGKFMAVNGAGVPNVRVWYFDLPNIQPNTQYEFSTWITSLHETNPAVLQFSINGQLMAEPFHAYPSTCVWYQFFFIWESDTNTQADISIVNQNTILSGNDFALDDITFATAIVYYDTVYVTVIPKYNSVFSAPDHICSGEPATIQYNGNAPDTAQFHWDFGNANILSGSGPGPYQVEFPNAGTGEISLWVGGEVCPSDTSYNSLEIYDSPEVAVSADASIIPYNSSTTLHGSFTGSPGPFVFSWDPPGMLVDPNSQDPQTLNLLSTTTFTFNVSDQTSDCESSGQVTVTVAGGPLGVSVIASPPEICYGNLTELTATPSGGTGSFDYSWTSNPPGFTSTLSTVTVQPEQTTTYIVTVSDGLSTLTDSVSVLVNQLPIANAGPDKVIDYGTSTSLEGSATGGSGNYSYHWEPSDLLDNADIANPATNILNTITQFSLVVTDLQTGCVSNQDQVIISINGGPLAVFIQTDSTNICKGDEVTLTAYGSGGSQGNYSYSWEKNGSSFGGNTVSISDNPQTSSTYSVEIDDGFTKISGQITITVNPLPVFSWSMGHDTIIACPYDSVSLSTEPALPGWTYLWSNGWTGSSMKVGTTGIGYDQKEYSLRVRNGNLCDFERNITVVFDFSVCSGLDEHDASAQIKVYPNPAKGKLNFELPTSGGKMEILIYNAQGIMKNELSIPSGENSAILNVSAFNQGLYYFILKDKKGNIGAGKFVIGY